MEKIFHIAKDIFGITNFYDLQFEIIKSILEKKNTIAIMPTGGGKSICYQLPALIFDGLTIVVSPIISLMKDQVENLKKRYNLTNVEYLSSTRIESDIEKVINQLTEYKIIYITPERLKNKKFLNSLKKVKISMLVIDEAHCISLWGNSFRSSYLEIIKFVRKFKIDVISAFTATANKKIIDDIKFYLGLKDPIVFKKSIYRDNLKIQVKLVEEKKEELLKIIDNRNTVIFTSSKFTLSRINNFLKFRNPTIYHADLSKEEKNENQDKFLKGISNLMIATSAFGMGIDKKDIRKIIHIDLPYEIEEYFQEIGRAGRDGEISECVFLVSFEDFENHEKMIAKKYLNYNFLKLKLKNYIKKIFNYKWKILFNEIVKLLKIYYHNKRKFKAEIKKFNIMRNFIFYDGCRFAFLLDYFGEEKNSCKKCDRCDSQKLKIDPLEKIILATLTKNLWIKYDTLFKILQGKSLKYKIFPGYGKLRGISPEKIKISVYNLFNQNLIKIKTIKNSFYLKSKV